MSAAAAHLPFSFTSSYGLEYGWLVINVRPDSVTRGPWPFRNASSQIGANIALSWMICWMRCTIASRFLASRSLACSPMRPSTSG